MAAIRCSSDGLIVFIAAEDVATGNQIITQMDAATFAFTDAYAPAGGSAAGVLSVPGNPDKMLFYGNFGTDITVLSYLISTAVTTDISPTSLGAKVVNTCSVNPSNENEIIITVGTDQDLLYTSNGGTSWAAWDAALGFNATALMGLWSSPASRAKHRYMVCGENGALDLEVQYSPNQGGDTSQLAESTLQAATAITNVEVVNG